MILFNLIASQNITELSSIQYVNSASKINKIDVLQKSPKSGFCFAYVRSDIGYLSKSKKDLASSDLIQSNPWRRFVNTFWSQIIFLSLPNKLSEKHVAKLNSLNSAVGKGNYKHLLSQFSKSLSNNSIRSSLFEYDNVTYSNNMRYIWYKSLNFNRIRFLDKLFEVDKTKQKLNNLKNKLKNHIGFNSMPLYTVSNNLGQMIISEQAEQLNNGHLLFNTNTNSLYEGWFFVNIDDAKEYMNHIEKHYGLNSTNKALKIFTSNLETFYTISSIYNNKVLVRLVPDLNEIGNLLSRYRYYRNIKFHQAQNYGKKHFQGQPVYMINNDDNSDSYYYEIFVNKKRKLYRTLFTNYESAINTWNKLNINSSKSLIPSKPQLVVYNLEHFLKDQAYDSGQNDEFLLVPSKSSYQYAKTNQVKKIHGIMNSDMIASLSFFKLWTKRILWSLTSEQPVNW
uniref:Uncharacterized protein n=1 Tax=Corallina officinalis TaxID=35170 RepID=A0A6M3WC11_COROI|nr:hypothetical protein [Corallina officinalis]QJF58651.1 hypothetical protein [Corallina officinalis]QJF58850.1 hypothetical protein [Corallina officinalis]